MSRAWRLLTHRGKFFVGIGLLVVLVAMAAGQRDVMRLGLLLLSLPVMLLWNYCLVGAVAGVTAIGWLQAWGIMVLFGFLFKSSKS